MPGCTTTRATVGPCRLIGWLPQCCTPQSGKELTAATANTFQLDALLVYHAALCLGTDQLSVTQLNTDYAYYKNLVTSLGKSPLPPC
jgi:hypothetical protein